MPRQPQTGNEHDEARRETTDQSRSAQSKLTSTGSPSAEAAGTASNAEEEERDALYLRAAELGINGRSRMTKADLTDAINEHESR